MSSSGARVRSGRIGILFVTSIVFVSTLLVSESSAQSPDPASAMDAPASAADATEDSNAQERPYWRTNLFGRFFRDQRYLFTTWWPAEFRRPGFTAPLLTGVAFALTSNQANGAGPDLELGQHLRIGSRGRFRGSARALSDLGDGATGALLLGSSYLIGRWSGNSRLAEASSLSAEALLTAGLWTSALKAASVRARPGGESRGEFLDHDAHAGESLDSFPSGHTTQAFTIATVFAGVYRDRKWVPWVAYGTAGLIGYSRVGLGRHFPSDVVVGALLGGSFGRMVLTHREESHKSSSAIHPIVDPAGQAVGFMWTYRR